MVDAGDLLELAGAAATGLFGLESGATEATVGGIAATAPAPRL